MKKKTYIILCIFFICIIAINIFIFNRSHQSYTKQVLSACYKDKPIGQPVSVTTNDPVEVDVNYEYLGSEDKEFGLYVYWDYEQIDFMVDSTRYSTYPIKEQSSTYTKKIRVKLDKKFHNHIHNLTIVIADRNFKASKGMRIRSQKEITFITDNSNEKAMDNFKTPYKSYSQAVPYLFVINSDSKDDTKKYTEGTYGKDKNVVTVKPNSQIELALRCKNFVGEGNQLIVLELNNKQIKVDGQSYLIYKLSRNDNFIYDKIKITAPSKPGEYSISSFIVPNPFNKAIYTDYTDSYIYKLKVE